MLWLKKKKRKKAIKPKPPVTLATPKQPKQTSKSEKKEKILRSKKPDIKKSKEKILAAEKEFLNTFGRLTNRYRAWDIWRDFITMFACSLSNPLDKTHFEKREALYLNIIKKYNKKEQEVFPELAAKTILALEDNPEQDFLGSIFMRLNLGNEHNGQIFTPYNICELMAETTMVDVLKKVNIDGYISINDPCCGAGATLIAGIHAAKKQLERVNLNYQNHILVVAQDIDETVALMCYIQLSLLGVAGYVKVGNSLTDPIMNNDTRENYWFTPMYFSNVWILRRCFGGC